MKFIKAVLKLIIAFILFLIIGITLLNEITPRPISLLVRRQFDTSKTKTIYPRPKDFSKKIRTIKVYKNVRYSSKYKNSSMDIYVPKRKTNIQRPVIFWVHGGGYVGGDKRDTRDYLELLSSDTDQVVVNINYALAPEYSHAVPVKQLNMAISETQKRFVNNINWQKVSIGGDSVGAQIASEYILSTQNQKIRKEDKVNPVISNSQVKKYVSLSGLLEPDSFTKIDDSVSRYLFKRCGWSYFNSRNFEKNSVVKNLSISKNNKKWNQRVFLTDGNTKTFTKQMLHTGRLLQKNHTAVTEVYYPAKSIKLGHEYQFDFSNRKAKETYVKLVNFFNN